ncbi:MFS transporter [Streptomyces sp. BPTC-684]|uniref:MFS transporter n=1 Tax=Streptomyces sp. BPTC-684 TaxID=3043734 RepID=UPI0024B0C145|nr:MFS transporter [Streptomyces sp. BPTC-684]WHM37978.1 MFS transporter [Streptomyces sp. BPTC-684]
MTHAVSDSRPEELSTETDSKPPPAGNRFLSVLSDKAMRAPLLWSIVGRFPLFLVTLALVMFATSRGTGYGSAGLLLACYSLGGAVLAPIVARRVDVHGQTPLLLLTGVVHPLALIALVCMAPDARLPQLVCVSVAGATIPPISGSVRSLWSALPTSGREAGFSLEAVLSEIFFIGGPLLLSGILFWGTPATALVVGGVLAGVGAIGFATTQASRNWRAEETESDLLGALRSPGLVRLLAVLVCAAVSTGVFNLALPAFAEEHGSADSVGLIFGAWGVGGVVGGLWYGSRTRDWPAERTLAIGLLLLSALTALPLLAWDNWSIGLALALGGLVYAPVTVVQYELVARTAPSGAITEAFTWVITVNVVGTAVGAQLGGLLVGAYGTWAAFVAAVAALLAGTAVAFAVRHRFTAPAGTPGSTHPDPAEPDLYNA